MQLTAEDGLGFQELYLGLIDSIERIENDFYQQGLFEKAEDLTNDVLVCSSNYACFIEDFFMYINDIGLIGNYDDQKRKSLYDIYILSKQIHYMAYIMALRGFAGKIFDARQKYMVQSEINSVMDIIEDVDVNAFLKHVYNGRMDNLRSSQTPDGKSKPLRERVPASLKVNLPSSSDSIRLRRTSIYALCYIFNEGWKNAVGNFLGMPEKDSDEAPEVNIDLDGMDQIARLTFVNNMSTLDKKEIESLFVPGVTRKKDAQKDRLSFDYAVAVRGGFGLGLKKIAFMASVLGGTVEIYTSCTDGKTYHVTLKDGEPIITEASPKNIPYKTGFKLVVNLPGAYTEKRASASGVDITEQFKGIFANQLRDYSPQYKTIAQFMEENHITVVKTDNPDNEFNNFFPSYKYDPLGYPIGFEKVELRYNCDAGLREYRLSLRDLVRVEVENWLMQVNLRGGYLSQEDLRGLDWFSLFFSSSLLALHGNKYGIIENAVLKNADDTLRFGRIIAEPNPNDKITQILKHTDLKDVFSILHEAFDYAGQIDQQKFSFRVISKIGSGDIITPVDRQTLVKRILKSLQDSYPESSSWRIFQDRLFTLSEQASDEPSRLFASGAKEAEAIISDYLPKDKLNRYAEGPNGIFPEGSLINTDIRRALTSGLFIMSEDRDSRTIVINESLRRFLSWYERQFGFVKEAYPGASSIPYRSTFIRGYIHSMFRLIIRKHGFSEKSGKELYKDLEFLNVFNDIFGIVPAPITIKYLNDTSNAQAMDALYEEIGARYLSEVYENNKASPVYEAFPKTHSIIRSSLEAILSRYNLSFGGLCYLSMSSIEKFVGVVADPRSPKGIKYVSAEEGYSDLQKRVMDAAGLSTPAPAYSSVQYQVKDPLESSSAYKPLIHHLPLSAIRKSINDLLLKDRSKFLTETIGNITGTQVKAEDIEDVILEYNNTAAVALIFKVMCKVAVSSGETKEVSFCLVVSKSDESNGKLNHEFTNQKILFEKHPTSDIAEPYVVSIGNYRLSGIDNSLFAYSTKWKDGYEEANVVSRRASKDRVIKRRLARPARKGMQFVLNTDPVTAFSEEESHYIQREIAKTITLCFDPETGEGMWNYIINAGDFLYNPRLQEIAVICVRDRTLSYIDAHPEFTEREKIAIYMELLLGHRGVSQYTIHLPPKIAQRYIDYYLSVTDIFNGMRDAFIEQGLSEEEAAKKLKEWIDYYLRYREKLGDKLEKSRIDDVRRYRENIPKYSKFVKGSPSAFRASASGMSDDARKQSSKLNEQQEEAVRSIFQLYNETFSLGMDSRDIENRISKFYLAHEFIDKEELELKTMLGSVFIWAVAVLYAYYCVSDYGELITVGITSLSAIAALCGYYIYQTSIKKDTIEIISMAEIRYPFWPLTVCHDVRFYDRFYRNMPFRHFIKAAAHETAHLLKLPNDTLLANAYAELALMVLTGYGIPDDDKERVRQFASFTHDPAEQEAVIRKLYSGGSITDESPLPSEEVLIKTKSRLSPKDYCLPHLMGDAENEWVYGYAELVARLAYKRYDGDIKPALKYIYALGKAARSDEVNLIAETVSKSKGKEGQDTGRNSASGDVVVGAAESVADSVIARSREAATKQSKNEIASAPFLFSQESMGPRNDVVTHARDSASGAARNKPLADRSTSFLIESASLINNKLMSYLFYISPKWPDMAINDDRVISRKGHALTGQELLNVFLKRDHPLKIKVFSEIDKLSEEDILKMADICLASEKGKDIHLFYPFQSLHIEKPLTLREAFIYPRVDYADLLRILLLGVNRICMEIDMGLENRQFIEAELGANYAIIKAIEILSRKPDLVIIRQQDLDYLTKIILNLGKLFIERIYEQLAHIPELIMPADTPQRQESLRNLAILFDKLKEANEDWEKYLAAPDKQADIQKLRDTCRSLNMTIPSVIVKSVSGQSTGLSKAERIRDILLEWRTRPEPLEVENFSLNDIKSGSRLASESYSGLDCDQSALFKTKAFFELENALPYLYEMTKEVLGIFRGNYTKILVAGRDAEILYDGLKTLSADMPHGNDIILFPASRAFIKYLTECDNSPLIIKYLGTFGITKKAINKGDKFLVIDTGFTNGLERDLKNLIKKVFGAGIDVGRLEKALDIKLVSAGNSDRLFSYRLKQFNIDDEARLKRMFPRSMEKLLKKYRGIDTIDRPDTRTNILIAVAIELLPHYNEPYLMLTSEDDGAPVAMVKRRRQISEDIDNTPRSSDSIVNPVAAMLVQNKVISYFRGRQRSAQKVWEGSKALSLDDVSKSDTVKEIVSIAVDKNDSARCAEILAKFFLTEAARHSASGSVDVGIVSRMHGEDARAEATEEREKFISILAECMDKNINLVDKYAIAVQLVNIASEFGPVSVDALKKFVWRHFAQRRIFNRGVEERIEEALSGSGKFRKEAELYILLHSNVPRIAAHYLIYDNAVTPAFEYRVVKYKDSSFVVLKKGVVLYKFHGDTGNVSIGNEILASAFELLSDIDTPEQLLVQTVVKPTDVDYHDAIGAMRHLFEAAFAASKYAGFGHEEAVRDVISDFFTEIVKFDSRAGESVIRRSASGDAGLPESDSIAVEQARNEPASDAATIDDERLHLKMKEAIEFGWAGSLDCKMSADDMRDAFHAAEKSDRAVAVALTSNFEFNSAAQKTLVVGHLEERLKIGAVSRSDLQLAFPLIRGWIKEKGYRIVIIFSPDPFFKDLNMLAHAIRPSDAEKLIYVNMDACVAAEQTGEMKSGLKSVVEHQMYHYEEHYGNGNCFTDPYIAGHFYKSGKNYLTVKRFNNALEKIKAAGFVSLMGPLKNASFFRMGLFRLCLEKLSEYGVDNNGEMRFSRGRDWEPRLKDVELWRLTDKVKKWNLPYSETLFKMMDDNGYAVIPLFDGFKSEWKELSDKKMGEFGFERVLDSAGKAVKIPCFEHGGRGLTLPGEYHIYARISGEGMIVIKTKEEFDATPRDKLITLKGCALQIKGVGSPYGGIGLDREHRPESEFGKEPKGGDASGRAEYENDTKLLKAGAQLSTISLGCIEILNDRQFKGLLRPAIYQNTRLVIGDTRRLEDFMTQISPCGFGNRSPPINDYKTFIESTYGPSDFENSRKKHLMELSKNIGLNLRAIFKADLATYVGNKTDNNIDIFGRITDTGDLVPIDSKKADKGRYTITSFIGNVFKIYEVAFDNNSGSYSRDLESDFLKSGYMRVLLESFLGEDSGRRISDKIKTVSIENFDYIVGMLLEEARKMDKAPSDDVNRASASGVKAQDEAARIHSENLKYMPSIPEKTILCHIITDSILPEGQRKMLKALEKNMRSNDYSEKVIAFSINDPDKFTEELSALMEKQRKLYEGYAVNFDVACPNVELVNAVLESNLGVKALAFEPCKDADAVQVEGIILALRALNSGKIESLREAFSILSGKELPQGLDINEIMRKITFILPAAKIKDYNEIKKLNRLIEENIRAAA
ncbi:MAG: ATP-binding protein [Candidatus Omnitrophota bacterium]|nr:ATP-binding protein [Candidatus Omnitrophota bacterium]